MSSATKAFHEFDQLPFSQLPQNRLQALLDLATRTAFEPDIHELLKTVLERISAVFDFDRAYVALLDFQNRAVFGEYALRQRHPHSGAQQSFIPTSESAWLMNIIENGTAVNLARNESEAHAVGGLRGFQSQCLFPLLSRAGGLGVLTLASLREAAFTDLDIRVLWQIASQVSVAVESVLAHRQIKTLEEKLTVEPVYAQDQPQKQAMFDEIIGSSKPLLRTLEHVTKVAPTQSTVLITGESGTGKELIARAIHKHSRRANRPFIRVNCAAIPSALIASELFGHEKGAFTGAGERRRGRFELAHGGTIFLDEIGDIPADTQIALLRVLQEREFERVGGSHSISVDVRIVAATNSDLKRSVDAGTFRLDLFYRLNVFPVIVPPLRERPDDIPLLTRHFIERYAASAGKRIRHVTRKTLDLLQSYPWPGNIRELQNVIECAVILCDWDTLSIDDSCLERSSVVRSETPVAFSDALLAREREMIEAALADTRGRIFGPAGAAVKLGIPRSTLESRIKSLRINKHRFKAEDPSTATTLCRTAVG